MKNISIFFFTSFFLIASNVFGAEEDGLSEVSTSTVRTVRSVSSVTDDALLPPREVELVVVETRTNVRCHFTSFLCSLALVGMIEAPLVFESLPKREAAIVLAASMFLVCMGFCCSIICKRK
ncbi:MAG: hypothetical protein FJX18_02305 [Alphaproteobacteria bacterium]|nr:hypothetical protein [Alphaproteobacteria bacterium]